MSAHLVLCVNVFARVHVENELRVIKGVQDLLEELGITRRKIIARLRDAIKYCISTLVIEN